MNAIEISGLSVSFGSFSALRSVSASFEAGKIHGIIGRNGSGKSVLFKCICGFITDYTGTIRIGGQDLRLQTRGESPIGMLIEAPGFVSGYSGFRNLQFLAGIRHRIGKGEIENAMKTVGLDPRSRKNVDKYSLGMRQRLGIAQAIMEQPDLMILDEPMNGLDNKGVSEMRALFKAMRAEGKPLLIASHNPLDIDALCDTVCEMDAGCLKPIFPPKAPPQGHSGLPLEGEGTFAAAVQDV